LSTPAPPQERLGVALLLSAAGGFLDAFTWVGQGGVFANAQTGDVVRIGVFAASGQWGRTWRHVPPIVAFLLGIFVAHRLRLATRRAPLVSLGIEIGLLALVAAPPHGFPDLPIVLGIAFTGALQTANFVRVEGTHYSSVMTSGNLRRAAGSLLVGLGPPRDSAMLRQAAAFGALCATFGVGAGLGALCTDQFDNPAVLVSIGLLLLAGVLSRG
jgi:uncharacterized membrane protein YoaK (UPF0700 family)